MEEYPEGGWGYMVALGLSIIYSTTMVPLYSFGLVFGDFLTSIDGAAYGPALSNGIYNTVLSFTGLLTSHLLQHRSPRTVTIIGSVLFFTGSSCIVLTKTLPQFIFCFGVLQGLGFGMMQPAALTSFNAYFWRKRNFIMALCQAIIVSVTLAWPSVTECLMKMYGWKGTQVIFAGLSLNCLIAGACFWGVKKRRAEAVEEVEKLVVPAETKNVEYKRIFHQDNYLLSNLPHQTCSLVSFREQSQSHHNLISIGGKIYNVTKVGAEACNLVSIGSEPSNLTYLAKELFHLTSLEDEARNLISPNTKERINLESLKEESSSASTAASENKYTAFFLGSDASNLVCFNPEGFKTLSTLGSEPCSLNLEQESSNVEAMKKFNTFDDLTVRRGTKNEVSTNTLGEMCGKSAEEIATQEVAQQNIWRILDLELFKDPIYANTVLGLAMSYTADFMFISILPMVVTSKGYGEEEATRIMTVHFTGDLLCNLFLPVLNYFFKVKNRYLFLGGTVSSIILRTSLTLSDSFTWIACHVFCLGFVRSFIQTPLPLVVAEKYGDRFTTAFSLYMVVCGFVTSVFGPLLGLVKSATDGYNGVIHTLTAAYLTCAVPWIIELCVGRGY